MLLIEENTIHDPRIIIQPTNERWACGRLINMHSVEAIWIVDFWYHHILYQFGGNIPYFEDVAWMFILEHMNNEGHYTETIDFANFDFDTIAKKKPIIGVWCIFLGLIKDPELILALKIRGGGRTYLNRDKPKNGNNPNMLIIDVVSMIKSRLPKRYIQ